MLTHMRKLPEGYKLDNVTLGNIFADSQPVGDTCIHDTQTHRQTDKQTHFLSSASSSFIAEKSAPPTPTIMMDIGSRDARMIAFFVSTMSESTPSVSSRRI